MTNQDPRAVWSQTTGHTLLHPQDMLGSGGEGSVYRLQSRPDLVAKVYHRNKLTSDTIKKLEVMIDHPPRTEDEQTGHIFVSWPKDTVHDTYQGPVIGFLMPMVDKTNDLYECYNPSSRRRNAPHVNYANLCSVAKSLATALDRLHGITYAYIIGDINESNAYITEDEQVTLIDADSFQVTDRRTTPSTIYRCLVGKPEYTPPELQSISFAEIDRNIHHDNFALAVVIYQLLMEGTHPFRGIYTDAGEKPQVETCITQGYFLHSARVGRRVPLTPPRIALPWESLPANLRALFRRCFDDGHSNPTIRPDPREWENALNEAMQDLVQCAQNPSHWYFGGQPLASGGPSCTWCERNAILRTESYPQYPESRDFVPRRTQAPPSQSASPNAPTAAAPPSNTIPPTPPSPPSTGGSIPAPGAGGERRPLWRMLIGLAVAIFWGGPGSARPLWLRLLGVAAGLWAAVVLVDLTLDGVNAFEERFIWPIFASEPPPPAVIAAAPPPTNTPMPPTSTPAPLHTSTPSTVVSYTSAPPNTPIAAVVVPTNTPIPTSAPTFTPRPTDTPTPRPTFTPSPTSTATHTPTPTTTYTPLPSNTPTPLPTLTPTPLPTSTHTPLPTSTPTPSPCLHFGPGVDLNRCDLSGKDLRGFNLTGANLSYANLTGVNFKDAVLTNATIAGASVEGVTLTNVDLSSTDITGIRAFDKAILVKVIFPVGLDLFNASFVDADLSRSSIVGANLESADFTRASLYRADLTGAVLVEANFSRANLDGTILNGANLQRANLASADFSDTAFDSNPDFRAADLRNASFFKAVLNGIDFSGARLDEANFNRAEMRATIFANADLNEADMKDANLQGVRFNGADVSDVNFSESDLSNANFQGADIEDAKFTEADLTGANFSGAMNADKATFSDTVCSDGITSDNCYSESRLQGIGP